MKQVTRLAPKASLGISPCAGAGVLALSCVIGNAAWAQITRVERIEAEPMERIVPGPSQRAPIGGTPPPGAAPPVVAPIAQPGAPPARVGGEPVGAPVAAPPAQAHVTQPSVVESAPLGVVLPLPPAPVSLTQPTYTDPKLGVGPGAGPAAPSMGVPAPGPATRAMLAPEPPASPGKAIDPPTGDKSPQGGPTQGVGIQSITNDAAPPPLQTNALPSLAAPPLDPAARTVVAPPASPPQPNLPAPISAPVTTAAPAVPNSTNPPVPSKSEVLVERRPKPVVQGAGQLADPGNSLSHPIAAGRSGAGIGEILPSPQDLNASLIPAGSIAKPVVSDQSIVAKVAQPACVPITFKPDPSRAAVTLIDFSGDGLIVSAVPNTHINAVFTRAGYRAIEITQPIRWCVAQTAARELLGPSYAPHSQASLVVPTKDGLQLMSQEQWLAYQASIKPEPILNKTVQRATQSVRSAASRVGRAPVARSSGASSRFPASALPKLR
jgi:hypothetical protein